MRQFRFLFKWVNFTLIFVITVFYLSLAGSTVLAQGITLTLTSVQPDQAANDVDTPIEISGSGFLNDNGDPQVFLGATQLTEVNWIDENTLTALVPWGLKAGSYTLKVVNPDGAEATLTTDFEVTQGIGQWNTNAIDGGPVQVILPIAPIPGRVYAYSWTTSAIYRSDDSGTHWSTVGHAGGQNLTYDPSQPDTLYLNQLKSSDGGATWQEMLPDGKWPGTDQYSGSNPLAFPDPAHAGTVFLAAADFPGGADDPSGLLRSVDYGQSWTAVDSGLNGDTNVTAMAFTLDKIYLGTLNGNIHQSTDGGNTWQKIGDSVLESIGVIGINPSSTELWVTSNFLVSANAKMIRVDLNTPSYAISPVPTWPIDQYPKNLGFLADDRVFIGTQWDNGWITVNDGADWKQLMPSTGKPGYCLALDPWDSSKRTFYIADEQYGVQKTTDMLVSGSEVTANWHIVNTGMHAMSPDAIAVDPENPSLVYQTVGNGWPGIFTSVDGGQNWSFSSIQTALGEEKPEWGSVRPITSTLAVSGGRIFIGFHGNDNWGYGPQLVYSDDQGNTWHRVSVDPHPREQYATSFHMPWTLKADPSNPNHLLLSAVIGNRDLTTDQYVSEIYRSTDRGETWQRANLFEQIGNEVNNLMDLGFDPHDPNIAYASNANNIYKSSDNGQTWSVILHVEGFPIGGPVAVEPVPPYRIYVGRLVSLDGGKTWDPDFNMPISPDQIVFVPGTDTMYVAGEGLAVSNNGGTTWQSMSGVMAKTKITSLEVSRKEQRIILYLGTPGGEGQVIPMASARGSLIYAASPAASSASLDAGVYRLTEVRNTIFLPFVSRR